MNANKKQTAVKYVKGTIGYEVAKLVKRYGYYSGGLSILALALEQATGSQMVRYQVKDDGDICSKEVGICGTPGWKTVTMEG